jgi:hypothetical protein
MNDLLATELGISEEERSRWGLADPAHIEVHTHRRTGQVALVVCHCPIGVDHRHETVVA